MKTSVLAAAFALVSLSLVACSGGGESTSSSSSSVSATTAESFCATYCDRYATCDSSTDKDTCMNECEDATATTLHRFRTDIIEPTRQCFATSDCKSVLGGKRLNECIEESAVSVAPSAAVKSFCDALGGAFDKCDAGAIDRAKCLNGFKVYGDETLNEATACTQKSCSRISDCIDSVFGE